MGTPADPVIDALHAGHDVLAPVVQALTAEQLRGPSAASDWNLSQVISHLGSGAVITLAGLQASLEGRANPGMDLNREVWARWDGLSPEERQAEFPVVNGALLAAYDGIDAATRESLRVDVGFLPAPVDLRAAALFRLNEFVLHSWDVRVVLDPSAALQADAVPLLLDMLPMTLGWLAKPDRLDGATAHLAVRLAGPEREFGLRLGEQIEITDVPAAPDGEVIAPAEAWVRLATGRLAPQWTPSSVVARGAADLDLLRTVFPGF